MTSVEIRQSFLDFFREKQHTIVPSSSLLPDAPNLLFTNAGMNQFVPIFLGQRAPDVDKWPRAERGSPTRAADTQKCIRAGGKHNDLEDVGLDTYHHTFFEMLGNWSFGDYFKREAIDWAWELLIERWHFPKERLYATYFQGDDKTPADTESRDLWKQHLPADHVVPGNRKDNFWMMGDTGPCGPCSEIHIDLTPNGDGGAKLVNAGSAQCIEIWNLVFIQYNANPDASLTPLPAKHVDTGMGFERVCSMIQCTNGFKDFTRRISNYETDVFSPIFRELEKLSGKKYTSALPGSSGSATVPVAAVPSHAVTEFTIKHRRLPHWQFPGETYFVTFRTANGSQLSTAERDVALSACRHWDGKKVELFAVVVMPDHVHLLLQPRPIEEDARHLYPRGFFDLGEIIHSIKSYSAHEINKVRGEQGEVWQRDRFDRIVRDDAEFDEKWNYIAGNAVKRGLAKSCEEYQWYWYRGMKTTATETVALPERGKQAVETLAPPTPDQIKIDIAFRVIADHIRCLSFAIADGITPSNEGRGYVLRRILRRAVRYGRNLGFREPFFHKLVDVVAANFGDVFPELRRNKAKIQSNLKAEEESFNRTLDRGIELLEEEAFASAISELAMTEGYSAQFSGDVKQEGRVLGLERMLFQRRGSKEVSDLSKAEVSQGGWRKFLKGTPRISGLNAFRLYDTYGFPLDLTELMARERGLTVDVAGFEKLMDEQRQRARADHDKKKSVVTVATEDLQVEPTKFLGYDNLEIEAVVEVVSPGAEKSFDVVLDKTPFYAEMGGQVGDTGLIGSAKVLDTQKQGNVFVHRSAAPLEKGQKVRAAVDATRRGNIQRHHTVTHLFHWALHEVVSRDARQKGSLVAPDRLRFDFNHPEHLSDQQIANIEKLVNERIKENAAVYWFEMPYADVRGKPNIMQFFGDKYGDIVRIVQIGGHDKALDGYSMELCGGTHTKTTGEIGLFKIMRESAVAAGIRRIEAVCGQFATEFIAKQGEQEKAEAAKAQAREQEKELAKQRQAATQSQAPAIAEQLLAKQQGNLLVSNLGEAGPELLRAVMDVLKTKVTSGIVVLGGAADGKVSLICHVTPDLVKQGKHAGKIVGELAKICGGGGGGRPDTAQAGGKQPEKLAEALAAVQRIAGL